MTQNTPLTVLQLDSSPAGSASISRQVASAIAAAVVSKHPGATLVERDLVKDPIPHLDTAALTSLKRQTGNVAPDEAVAAAARLNDTLVEEFLGADVVVIGAPMYNFSIPTQLKAWIDRVAQAGRTFRYTAEGPEGLAGGKKVIIVSTRGGRYAGQAAETAMDHQEAYLRAVLGFFGITDVTVVRAEGVAMGPEARETAIAAALEGGKSVAALLAA